MNSPTWLEMKLIRYFMAVQSLSSGQGRIRFVSALKGKWLQSEYSDLARIRISPRFIPILVTCKFDVDPIKIEGTIDRTMSNMGFFGTQAQVTPKWIVWSGRNSKSSEILWPSWLFVQDWRRSDKKCSRYLPDNIFSITSLWEQFSSFKGQ